MTRTTPPELWLLIGGNGSGKSTFHQQFLAPRRLPLVNADHIARLRWPQAPEKHSYDAALLAEQQRLELIEQGRSFCFETVFSHPSKLDFVARAKAAGYRIVAFYFDLGPPELNIARVATRVRSGGHNVPNTKIRQRLNRTRKLIQDLVGLCDELHLVDNASADRPFERVALWRQGQWTLYREHLPDWAAALIEMEAR